MTRFARAKGSKSSNERAPEDSTPWEVMKDQLLQAKVQNEEAKKREEAEKQRIVNYENFLKEHKTQKRKATWADFPETEQTKTKTSNVNPPSIKQKKKKKKHHNAIEEPTQAIEAAPQAKVSITPGKKSKKKKRKLDEANAYDIPNSTDNVEANTSEPAVVNIKDGPQKKKKKQKKQLLEHPSETNQVQKSDENNESRESNKTNKVKIKKNKNNKLNMQGISRSEYESNQVEQNGKSIQNNNQQKTQSKVKKFVDGMPVRRKPINDHSFQLIINGKEVELVRFDGFPIMKKDADRLEELKSNMIKKGIPKSEVNRTLKLERRRAEKALARLKRDVCYNCRKGGHNLSDCPELKTKIPGVGAPDGVCFKCGSTEHRQFECKVQKDKEFRFATCFICKEPGHIARQCPDNPKGLYPNGGGCKLCGDVTHLRKDCPTMMGKKEETSIKLQTLDSTEHLEGIEQKTNSTPQETTKKVKKIKF